MELESQRPVGKFTKLKFKVKGWPRWVKILLIIAILITLASLLVPKKDTALGAIKTIQVEKQDIEQSIITNGRLESTEKQEFFTPVDSTLMELSVKVGDRVEKGQVLGRLDTNELGRQYQQAVAKLAALEASLARAQAVDDELALKQAEASYDKAKNNLERINYLFQGEAIPIEQVEAAKVEYARAEVDYQQA
ncbi:hypothetical protein N752_23000 [Desulforamulus aquiferis]|nr:biotin/lipoyl-binding protein [Desulforamulus aquiferis]RYD02882.1 hypothetical protein N752_23000 [Desulforamulus aquiferis]